MSDQRGSGLLLLLVVLVAGASLYLAARDPGAARRAGRPAAASSALAAARETLLARALVDRNRPGSLPCAAPDAGGSGTFHGDHCDVAAGRFPFRTLETRPLRDRGGALLWYRLDPALRDRATREPINPQARPGTLSLDGVGHYAAVVVAPGEARPGQSRARGTRADYLDGVNAAGSDFVDCSARSRCNDIVRGISVDALFADVQRRVVAEVAAVLRDLWVASDPDPRRRYLPYAAAFGARECEHGRALGALATRDEDGDCRGPVLAAADLPGWVRANDWLGLVVYHVDPACTEARRRCDAAAMALGERGGLAAVVAAAGRPWPGQSRPGAGVADYLEAPANTDGDGSYVERTRAADANDALRAVTLP